MRPFFADAIDFPVVIVGGIIVLVPLLAFEVFVEAYVLKKMWRLGFRALCGLTMVANVLSLLAGIPTEFLNSMIDARILPNDIPGYFARYPLATAIDSLFYFIVTVMVEGLYARRWLRQRQFPISTAVMWRGVMVANIVSYAVVAPLNYFASRPNDNGLRFTAGAQWTAHPAQTMLFVDGTDHFLKSTHLDGSEIKTVVGTPMADYLISSNLDLCVFRGTNGALYLYRQQHPTPEQVWNAKDKFFMAQVAFSPSGNRVAFVSDGGILLQIYEAASGRRLSFPLAHQSAVDEPSVAWSLDEGKLYVSGAYGGVSAVTITAGGDLSSAPLAATNGLAINPCYGRLSSAESFGDDDWGVIYNNDSCGSLSATIWPGLDSGLRIFQKDANTREPLLTLSVRPGLLHIAQFGFDDVAFLDGCGECAFDANGYVYLLDINAKRVGTLARGDRFILLTSRYLKTL